MSKGTEKLTQGEWIASQDYRWVGTGDPKNEPICGVSTKIDEAEQKANAQAISATKELIECVLQFKVIMDEKHPKSIMANQINATLKKAGINV